MFVYFCLLLLIGYSRAEDGYRAWLRYAPAPPSPNNKSLPSTIIALDTNTSSPVCTAGNELQQGLKGILGKDLTISTTPGNASRNAPSIVVGTVSQFVSAYGDLDEADDLEEDGFFLSTEGPNVVIVGQNERGALYGAFEYLSRVAQGKNLPVSYVDNPHAPIRWVNEWDNLDGTIERGYAGPSIFFEGKTVTNNLTRVADYARLLASIRINGIIVNNVNADPFFMYDQFKGLGLLADAMRPYGVQLGLAVNFAAPMNVTHLDTYDAENVRIIDWWNEATKELYGHVPDLAGYIVKASSEGQPGPSKDKIAAWGNTLARALKPFGGVLIYRAFVYDHHLNESIWKADRANAAVEYFKQHDGNFDDNVIVQIKYGPIDFQVREPVSPLFSALRKSNTMIELQVTQEYLGHQNHLVYLAPLWKEILEFDMRVDGQRSKVKDIISGETFRRPLGGSAAVVNVGTDRNWLGSHLAMSNLYAYGKLAWDPSLGSEEILQDWIRLTFGFDQQAMSTLTYLSMNSWQAYENYTGNLGIQTLVDILYTHYGPNPANMDNNGWGQWTRADQFSIGMDRTVKNGTGNAGQYEPEVAAMYENIETTPDDLLLWFHHVNYTHRLKSGKTVIQHFYDAHYAGASTAHMNVPLFRGLEKYIDAERYNHMLFRLRYQAGHAAVWRDCINQFYYNLSGIPDQTNRTSYRQRIEAEDMELSGYEKYVVDPFHAASGSNAIVTTSNSTAGTATIKSPFPSRWYDIAVNYYDLLGGNSTYQLSINNQTIGTWTGDLEKKSGYAASKYLDGHSAARVWFQQILVQKGDTIRIVGQPNGLEPAPIDYVAFFSPNGWD